MAVYGAMRYIGGKVRMGGWVRDHIAALPRRPLYVEPFVGGAATFKHLAPLHAQSIAADAHPDLIMMWQALAHGWTPPSVVTQDMHRLLRMAQPSALRAFAGFGCSIATPPPQQRRHIAACSLCSRLCAQHGKSGASNTTRLLRRHS